MEVEQSKKTVQGESGQTATECEFKVTFYHDFVDPRTNKLHPPQSYRLLAKENWMIYEAKSYTNRKGKTINISDQIAKAVEGAKLYQPDYKYEIPKSGKEAGVFEFTHETTTCACHRLIVEERLKTVALNYANPWEPGGGFLRGAIAQEECICRSSILFNILSLDKLSPMYEASPRNDVLATDYMSLAPGIVVFRDDEYEFLDEPFLADFLSAAAPLACEWTGGQKKLYQTMETRVKKIILCAIENKYEAIVLGAFGSGAFGNNIEDLAEVFKKLLIKKKLRFFFKKVVFAVFSPTDEKVETLQSVLQGHT